MAKSVPNDDVSVRDESEESVSEVKRKPRSTTPAKTKKVDEKADKKVDEKAAELDVEDAPKSGNHQVSLTIDLRKLAAAVGVAALVALLVVGGWQWYAARQKVAAFTDAKAAASKYVVTSIEYMSADKVDKAKEVQGPLVTGKMREELSQDRSEASKSVRDLGLKTTGKVDAAAVERLERNEATVLLVVTATGTSNMSPTPQQSKSVLRLEMRREGGKWLVAESKGVGYNNAGSELKPGPAAPGAPAPK